MERRNEWIGLVQTATRICHFDPRGMISTDRANMMTNTSLKRSASLEHSQPMWKRVPVRDEQGNPCSDFMMLFPKLGTSPQLRIQQTIDGIQEVLNHYEKFVVFADLNLKRNILWISVKAVPGICVELPAAIQARVAGAKLVGQYF